MGGADFLQGREEKCIESYDGKTWRNDVALKTYV